MKSRRAACVMTALLGVGLAILAGKAFANSATFAFTMELRAVHGNKNLKLHALDAGELTLSGAVWVVSKNRGASSTPDTIDIAVKKDNALKSQVCSATVIPNTVFNAKRSFEKSCGRIESGTYWIDVNRPTEDGWHVKGSGTLVTK